MPSKPDDRLVNLAAAFEIDSSDKFSAENRAPDISLAVEQNPLLPPSISMSYIYLLSYVIPPVMESIAYDLSVYHPVVYQYHTYFLYTNSWDIKY